MSESTYDQDKIIIKKASIQHLDSLVDCWVKMVNQSYSSHITKLPSPRKIYQLILRNQKYGFFMLAYGVQDGVEKLMGVSGIVYAHPASKRWWAISAYVLPQYRKLKISQKLYNKECEIAKAAGTHDIFFYTNYQVKTIKGIKDNVEQLLIDIPLSTKQQYENSLGLSGYENTIKKYRVQTDLSGVEEQPKIKQLFKIYHRETSQGQKRIYCYEKEKLVGFCQHEIVLYVFAGRIALITALYIDKQIQDASKQQSEAIKRLLFRKVTEFNEQPSVCKIRFQTKHDELPQLQRNVQNTVNQHLDILTFRARL